MARNVKETDIDVQNIPAPPFPDAQAARAAMQARYPEYSPMLRVGGPSLDALSRLLLEKRLQAQQLEREIVALECQIKDKIGLFKGLKTKVGTWLWENEQQTRLNYKKLVQWMNANAPEALKELTRPTAPTRILRFINGKGETWPIKKTSPEAPQAPEPVAP